MKTTKKWSKVLLAGVAAMVLVFGLVLAGCDDGNPGGDNPFVGNWTGTASIGEESAAAAINVTATGWNFVCPEAGMNDSGTYTYSGTSAVLSANGTTIGSATVSGGTLTVTLTGGDYAGGTGTFTK